MLTRNQGWWLSGGSRRRSFATSSREVAIEQRGTYSDLRQVSEWSLQAQRVLPPRRRDPPDSDVSATALTTAPQDNTARRLARRANDSMVELRKLLNHALEHHHVDQVTWRDIALRVMQHDETVGLHHRAQHA